MPKLRPDAILFDLDGTLIDSAHDLLNATNQLLALEDLAPINLEQIKICMGDKSRQFVPRTFALAGKILNGEDIERLLPIFRDIYSAIPTKPECVFYGVVDLLSTLRKQGIKIGICTNKSREAGNRAITQTGLAPLIDVLVGADTAGEAKPSPAPLLHALKALNARASNSIMIGDHMNDILSARAAGMYVIAVNYGYTKEWPSSLQPDAFANSIADCKTQIDSIRAYAA